MRSKFYLPILKSKTGEFNALSKLEEKVKNFVVPLLEVTPMEWDHSTKAKPRTMEEHLNIFCKKVLKSWPRNDTFIDTNLINDKDVNGKSCTEYIYDILHANNVKPIPVINMSSSSQHITAIGIIDLMYSLSDIGFRVSIENITSPTFEEDISTIMNTIGYSPANSHLILDLKDSDFSNFNDFSEGIVDVLEGFPNFQNWKSFTICGGSFPSTGKIKGPVELVPRNEWNLYKKIMQILSQKTFNRLINYGDYSMVSPKYIEFDPTKMSTSANIRYTHNDIWVVVKGKALKKAIDWQQYFTQAKNIVESKYYMGENYSFGDLHLKKCSKRNPNIWNTVGNNHHFTKVVMDLFAKPRVI